MGSRKMGMSRVPLLFEQIGAKDDAFLLYQRQRERWPEESREREMADIAGGGDSFGFLTIVFACRWLTSNTERERRIACFHTICFPPKAE